jgi:N-acetylglucosamine-6-sulfatase
LFRDRWRSLLSVDDAVVGVMQALADLSVLDNTFMFFTSDHGYK